MPGTWLPKNGEQLSVARMRSVHSANDRFEWVVESDELMKEKDDEDDGDLLTDPVAEEVDPVTEEVNGRTASVVGETAGYRPGREAGGAGFPAGLEEEELEASRGHTISNCIDYSTII